MANPQSQENMGGKITRKAGRLSFILLTSIFHKFSTFNDTKKNVSKAGPRPLCMPNAVTHTHTPLLIW